MNDDPRIDPADLRNVRFPGSSRRYDARSVEQFLESVASRIEATNALVDELRRELFEVRESTPATPPPAAPELSTLDDDDLVRLIGEETASVLSTARRAAEEIRSKAEESAARMIREATADADRLTDEAKARVVELTADAEQAMERATAAADAEAARIRAEAEQDAETRIAETAEKVAADLAELEARRTEADAEVEQILADAREEGRGMVTEAKEVRHRILEDLQRRRDMAREQIERLLAGRERLLAAYELVRENLDDITGQLADSLPDPRHLPEPELPDGFVGIVGGEAMGDTDDATLEDEVAIEADEEVDEEVDDTVAPADDEEVDEAGGSTVAEVAAAEHEHPDHDHDDADDDDAGDATDGVEADEPGAAQDSGAEEIEASGAGGTGADGTGAGETGAGDDGAGDGEAGDHEAGGGDVDALFARLRAEREQSVAKAQQVLEGDAGPAEESAEGDAGGGDAAGGDAGATGESDGGVAAEPDADQGDAAEPDADQGDAEIEPVADETADATAAAGDETDGRAGDVDQVPTEFLADPEALDRRAEALKPLDGRLNRALKRQLADEQNELLDLLRRSGSTDAGELLPPAEEQVATYARVATKHLTAAAAAGVAAAGGSGTDVDVDGLARALGATLVDPFRRRVERSASEVDGDADELDERLRALYREWKVQHIAPATDDALLSAYALGTLTAARPDGRVRWCIDPQQGPCPDAQDNALAGVVAAGEAFPTGDECPQAHPGCRCLLVAE